MMCEAGAFLAGGANTGRHRQNLNVETYEILDIYP